MFFSIIIPVFNTEQYLPQCLDSVLSQSFSDFEVICVDDGSTDRSLEILETYAAQNIRIKVIRNNRKGVSSARNAGLDIAKGDYIIFVDSDDWILPGALESFHGEIFLDKPAILVFPSKRYLEKDGKYIEDLVYSAGSFESGAVYFEIAANNKTRDALGTICGKVYSSRLLKENGVLFCEDISHHEDLLFIIDALSHAGMIHVIPKSYYVYRIRLGGSLMTTFSCTRYLDMVRVANLLCEKHLNRNVLSYDILCRMISSYYRNSLIWGGRKMYREIKGMIDWDCFRKTSSVSVKTVAVYYGLRVLPYVVIPVLSYRNNRQIVKLRKQDNSNGRISL